MPCFEYGQVEIDYLRRRDERLGQVIDSLGMLKAEMYPDLFTALISSVIGQQISGKAAATVWNRVVERFGEITPTNLHQASLEDIQSCGTSFRKASYVKGIAEACENGGLDLEGLKALPDEEVVKALVSLKGIGPWTAEMMLIFSLGRKDVVSWGDLAIRRGMISLYGLESLDRQEFDRFREKYRPYGSVASLYIWELAHRPELLATSSRKTV
ncbi:MAG TPA: DNA-3-methyladenine glycosylase [Methanomassiliicoccales archaeon]|nr:DNA-3-methyladenine glycosylase [Methanomassiliicoccales archaeon]HPR98166.1 DNA-3-methyladenine glycosylase [Methanomassiliicoccales archaeon]